MQKRSQEDSTEERIGVAAWKWGAREGWRGTEINKKTNLRRNLFRRKNVTQRKVTHFPPSIKSLVQIRGTFGDLLGKGPCN